MRLLVLLIVVGMLAPVSAAQSEPYNQSHFPAEEFRARWEKIYEKIGEGVAIVQGAPKVRGFDLPRQTNEFYYLCGIDTPHSYILLDGARKKAIICLPPRDESLERAEGRILSAGDAELVERLTGADEVWSTRDMTPEAVGKLLKPQGAAIYTPFAPAEG